MSVSVTKDDFAQWRDNPVTRLFFKYLSDQKEYYQRELSSADLSKASQPLLSVGAYRGILSTIDFLLETEAKDLEEYSED